MSDANLVRAIQRGDHAAFEALYRRHKDAIFRYACALSGRPGDAEDLVQEAFLGFLRAVGGFDAERSALAYLLASVRNRHVDARRAFSGRAQPIEPQAAAAHEGEPERQALERERSALVAEALGKLPEPQREAVRLHVFAGLSYDEISAAESVPAATVRSRYRAGLERLRELLGRRVAHG